MKYFRGFRRESTTEDLARCRNFRRQSSAADFDLIRSNRGRRDSACQISEGQVQSMTIDTIQVIFIKVGPDIRPNTGY